MASKKKTAEAEQPADLSLPWRDIADGWRARRKSDGSVQIQTTTGAGSITLSPEGWQDVFESLLFGGPVVDTQFES